MAKATQALEAAQKEHAANVEQAMAELIAAQKEQAELLRALSQKLEPMMEKNNVSD